jgi:hypothetical protein
VSHAPQPPSSTDPRRREVLVSLSAERWRDRRTFLRKKAISALYPLSARLPLGAYEQPELWVSDALGVCYVVNPKVACSSIQAALTEAATGVAVAGYRHNHPAVLAFRRIDFGSVPAGYFCFSIVRHPIDRIVSFYKDKFLRPRIEGRPFEYAGYLGGIFDPADDFATVCAKIATIPDRLADRHFIAQGFWFDEICRACLDHVGHLEDLDRAWAEISRRLGREIALPRINSTGAIAFAPEIPSGLRLRYAADLRRFSYAP